MTDEVHDVKFKGKAGLILVGNVEKGGVLATREQYEQNEESFAHLFADGTVKRLGKQIGTVDDIVFVDE